MYKGFIQYAINPNDGGDKRWFKPCAHAKHQKYRSPNGNRKCPRFIKRPSA